MDGPQGVQHPARRLKDDRADAATQCLRYIADDNDFPIVRELAYSPTCSSVERAEFPRRRELEDDGQGSANVTITQVPSGLRIWV